MDKESERATSRVRRVTLKMYFDTVTNHLVKNVVSNVIAI